MSKSLIRHLAVTVDVDASPEEVWAVVSDPTRVGEWSVEAVGCEWRSTGDVPYVGARFAGSNRIDRLRRWERQCEVVACDEPHRFAWRTIASWRFRDTTTWTVTLDPVESGGTRIRQSYDLTGPEWLLRLLWRIVPSHRDRTAELEADLRRLGEVARSTNGAPAPV